jgi:hypothetical protein
MTGISETTGIVQKRKSDNRSSIKSGLPVATPNRSTGLLRDGRPMGIKKRQLTNFDFKNDVRTIVGSNNLYLAQVG